MLNIIISVFTIISCGSAIKMVEKTYECNSVGEPDAAPLVMIFQVLTEKPLETFLYEKGICLTGIFGQSFKCTGKKQTDIKTTRTQNPLLELNWEKSNNLVDLDERTALFCERNSVRNRRQSKVNCMSKPNRGPSIFVGETCAVNHYIMYDDDGRLTCSWCCKGFYYEARKYVLRGRYPGCVPCAPMYTTPGSGIWPSCSVLINNQDDTAVMSVHQTPPSPTDATAITITPSIMDPTETYSPETCSPCREEISSSTRGNITSFDFVMKARIHLVSHENGKTKIKLKRKSLVVYKPFKKMQRKLRYLPVRNKVRKSSLPRVKRTVWMHEGLNCTCDMLESINSLYLITGWKKGNKLLLHTLTKWRKTDRRLVKLLRDAKRKTQLTKSAGKRSERMRRPSVEKSASLL